mmetsp:Transcript_53129/g.108343  ORF Transcript_53129/g.108343 Transcript_53129/m.108343 type:complete len:146 (+) Transcript_53129:162-599(+)
MLTSSWPALTSTGRWWEARRCSQTLSARSSTSSEAFYNHNPKVAVSLRLHAPPKPPVLPVHEDSEMTGKGLKLKVMVQSLRFVGSWRSDQGCEARRNEAEVWTVLGAVCWAEEHSMPPLPDQGQTMDTPLPAKDWVLIETDTQHH